MPMRSTVACLTLAVVGLVSCRTARPANVAGTSAAGSTVFGHWVLATPADSTPLAGASQVDLVLEAGSFNLTLAYPDRAPLTISGRSDLAGNTITLTPRSENVTSVGLTPGQAVTRIASVSGSTLVLALPTSRIPVASSVWYRLEAARLAGLAK
jgi:delta 1-pyrroline-5-carboxylate dehydrogenase